MSFLSVISSQAVIGFKKLLPAESAGPACSAAPGPGFWPTGTGNRTIRRFEDQKFNISKVGRCAALLAFGAMLRSYTHDA